MRKILLVMAVLVLVGGAAGTARAGAVYNGSIYRLDGEPAGNPAWFNTTVSTVDYLYFTVNSDDHITIDLLSVEFDWNTFNVFDVNGDGEIAFIDPYIYLFHDDGDLDGSDFIAGNDDYSGPEGAADGSISALDSYLSLPLAAGNYILSVGTHYLGLVAPTEINDASWGPYTAYDGDYNWYVHGHGDYRVTWTGDVTLADGGDDGPSPVPAPPAVWLLAFGLISLVGLRRRIIS